MKPEPAWLVWARSIQAIAQSGLAYDPPLYDRERYESLRDISAQMMAAGFDTEIAPLAASFAAQTGYATPKTDVRGAAFRDGRILLVRETADAGRWTLPGGWADVNLTPAENVTKEMQEETGFLVRATKLASVWDRVRQGHPPGPFQVYRLFFLCDIIGGEAAVSAETSEIGFFGRDALPADLSLDRVLQHQILRMFDHATDPALPTDFD